MADTTVSTVTFFFDPACPWTWVTSRWLVDAAAQRDVPVRYRPFELSNGAPVEDAPEQYRPAITVSRSFLRTVHALHEAGRDDVVGAWYTAYGTAVWGEQQPPSIDLATSTLVAAGGAEFVESLDDTGLDAAVAKSRVDAQEWSGTDTGSPVTLWEWDGGERGFFGPVIAPKPAGDDADLLWDSVVSALRVPQFFELKAKRTAPPQP